VVLDLACLEKRIHRHYCGAGAQRSVVQDRKLHDVRQCDCDPVSRSDAAGSQPTRRACSQFVEFGIGDDDVVQTDRRPVVMTTRGLGEDIG